MPDTCFPSPKLRFDTYEFDFQKGELRRDGQLVRLQEQPCRVLSRLLQRPGEIVTREELRHDLWPADTFVDFDHGLNSAVARLRESLRDSAENPRFVETIAKRGYRFICAVQTRNEPPYAAIASPSQATSGAFGPRIAKAIWITAAVMMILGSGAGIWALYRPDVDTQLTKIEVVPLVGLRGFQATPAISPDGSLVAFRQSDDSGNAGIYVATVGGDKSIQLTSDPSDCCPTWSPDGRQIAFSRYSKDLMTILTVPALGGTVHQAYQGPSSWGAGLSWSPDGNKLAFVEGRPGDQTHCAISELSLADLSIHKITSPPPGSVDRSPMFSPDGKHLAFIRSAVAGVSNDVYVMPTGWGRVKRVTFDNRPIMGSPAWTSDSKELIFSSNRGAAVGLWRVCASGCAPPRPVAGPVGDAKWPSTPVNGENALVYEQGLSTFNIWRLQLKDPKRQEWYSSPLVSEKGDKMRPELSPDGKKVAFESNRLGFWDIWTCEVDGKGCDQITSLHGTAGRARWSPDGRYIAFEFHPKDRSEIYVVEVPGGVPHLISTIPGADNLSPSWSRDGRSLYFASKSGDEPFEIWKMPFPTGNPVRVTKNGGIGPQESLDGRYLFYSKYEREGLWKIPVEGGDESEVLSEIGGGGWANWALGSEGIYYLRFGKLNDVSIDYLDLGTGKSHQISTLPKEPGWGLSLSADGKSIVYVLNEYAESNLMFVKNFR